MCVCVWVCINVRQLFSLMGKNTSLAVDPSNLNLNVVAVSKSRKSEWQARNEWGGSKSSDYNIVIDTSTFWNNCCFPSRQPKWVSDWVKKKEINFLSSREKYGPRNCVCIFFLSSVGLKAAFVFPNWVVLLRSESVLFESKGDRSILLRMSSEAKMNAQHKDVYKLLKDSLTNTTASTFGFFSG